MEMGEEIYACRFGPTVILDTTFLRIVLLYADSQNDKNERWPFHHVSPRIIQEMSGSNR